MAEELSGLIESKFKAARVAMRNEMAQAKDASDLDKEGLALAEKMMEMHLRKMHQYLKIWVKKLQATYRKLLV